MVRSGSIQIFLFGYIVYCMGGVRYSSSREADKRIRGLRHLLFGRTVRKKDQRTLGKWRTAVMQGYAERLFGSNTYCSISDVTLAGD